MLVVIAWFSSIWCSQPASLLHGSAGSGPICGPRSPRSNGLAVLELMFYLRVDK